jgi:hypothetical protein
MSGYICFPYAPLASHLQESVKGQSFKRVGLNPFISSRRTKMAVMMSSELDLEAHRPKVGKKMFASSPHTIFFSRDP